MYVIVKDIDNAELLAKKYNGEFDVKSRFASGAKGMDLWGGGVCASGARARAREPLVFCVCARIPETLYAEGVSFLFQVFVH